MPHGTSGQFGESQTLRKSEAFSKWHGRIIWRHTAKAVHEQVAKRIANAARLRVDNLAKAIQRDEATRNRAAFLDCVVGFGVS